MTHLNLALTMIIIKSKNSLAEIALKLLKNKRYVINLVIKDVLTQYSAVNRESTSFVVSLMIIYTLLLTHKSFNSFID